MACPSYMSLADRIAANTRRDESGCLLWIGTVDKATGYGKISVGGKDRRAHRVVYEEENGPIPDGLCLDHLCRVKRCVELTHLEPVTVRENTLRGLTIPAENAQKTHCVNGHPFDATNTFARGTNRGCKICRRENLRNWRKRLRALAGGETVPSSDEQGI